MASESPQAALNREFLTLLRLGLRAIAVLFPFIAITEALAVDDAASRAILAFDISLALVFIVMAWAVSRRLPPPEWGHPLGFLIATLCHASALLTLYYERDFTQTGNVSVIIASVGFLFLSTPWFVGYLVFALASWAALTRITFGAEPSLLGTHSIYPATVAAGIIHLTRVQTTLRLQALMRRNEEQRAELEAALGSAEQVIGERQRAETELVGRVEFERLISHVSKLFVNVRSRDLDDAVRDALSEIGRLTQADRTHVFRFSSDREWFSCTHEWCAEGIERQIEHLQELPVSEFPYYAGEHLHGRRVSIPRVEDLRAKSSERVELERQGVKSALTFALASSSAPLGFMSLDAVREHRQWPENMVEMLGLLTEMIAGALERRDVEEALLTSEGRYRLLADSSVDMIWRMDARFQMIYVTPSIKQLLGYTAEELKEKGGLGELIDPDYRERVAYGRIDEAAAVLDGLKPGEAIEMRFIHRDGRGVWTETSATVLRDAAGRIIGLQGITRDITPRKQIEEEKAGLEDRLLQSQKMEAIGTLAGGIAHDFNNLLTGILGYANLMKLESRPGEKVYNAADVIERAAERAAQLTRQLLGFARKGKFQNTRIDVHATIREVLELLSRTIDKSIDTNSRLLAREAIISGDPTQIQQVILNIAVNARDAMPHGGKLRFETDTVEFDGSARPTPPGLSPGRYLRLRVSDTGHGIPSAIRARIFEPFFTTKEPGKGTGMGLATVYGIVKNHGGAIQIESEEGRGTVFEVLLPALESGAVKEEATPERIQMPATATRIMLVDDEAVVCSAASAMLERLGYEVAMYTDPVAAVKDLGSGAPGCDLVILDMIMPRLDGLACLRAIKQARPQQRILLSSGFERDGLVVKALREGALGFVQKPYKLEVLAHAVARALAKKIR